jgi:hypothetical protein
LPRAWQFFHILDALRQEVRIYDPDRLVERFNVGVAVETALTRSVRTGDHPKGRPLEGDHFSARNPSADPKSCRFSRRALATFRWNTVVRSSMKVVLLASKDKTRTNFPAELRMRFSRTEPGFFFAPFG